MTVNQNSIKVVGKTESKSVCKLDCKLYYVHSLTIKANSWQTKMSLKNALLYYKTSFVSLPIPRLPTYTCTYSYNLYACMSCHVHIIILLSQARNGTCLGE